MQSANPLDYPPVWLALCAAGAWLAGRVWRVPSLSAPGWGLVAMGLALMGIAAWTMWRAGATVDPTRPPTALVTHGVFARSRNPIYLADAVILLGLCLIWQPLAAIILVPLFTRVISRRFIPQEEAWLRARDAAAFDAWAARTPRWL